MAGDGQRDPPTFGRTDQQLPVVWIPFKATAPSPGGPAQCQLDHEDTRVAKVRKKQSSGSHLTA